MVNVTNTRHAIDAVREQLRLGELTAAQANVAMVRAERVRIVTSRVPAQVRASLQAAVKNGSLGHLAKDGYKPEAYFHPEFEYLARGERAEAERRTIDAMKIACAGVLA